MKTLKKFCYLIRYYYICDMKQEVFCPRCRVLGRNETLLLRHEDVIGRGDLYVWCKRCRREVRIPIRDLSLDE